MEYFSVICENSIKWKWNKKKTIVFLPPTHNVYCISSKHNSWQERTKAEKTRFHSHTSTHLLHIVLVMTTFRSSHFTLTMTTRFHQTKHKTHFSFQFAGSRISDKVHLIPKPCRVHVELSKVAPKSAKLTSTAALTRTPLRLSITRRTKHFRMHWKCRAMASGSPHRKLIG